jgi:DNA polymerase-1
MQHSTKEILYLIDGSGFIFRAYHALPPLTRKDGVPIGAVLGFTNMLVKLLTDMEAHSLAVVFDAARKTFRNDIYADYKGTRKETPEDLIPQFPLIRDACKAFSVPTTELEGFEADDLIAAYARTAVGQGMQVVIVSSDKDLMQLVGSDIKLYDPLKNIFIDAQKVKEKFGVGPDQVIDVQALAGDTSDNIPGVPGIGVKTAAALIEEFGNLETLLAKASSIKQEKRRDSLILHAEQARISKRLVTLDDKAPLPLPLSNLRVQFPTPEKVFPFLQEQGFKNLEERLFKNIEKKEKKASSYDLILTKDQLSGWVKKIQDAGLVAVDTETDSLNALGANLVGISFSTAPGDACYIPVQYYPVRDLLDGPETHKIELSRKEVLDTLRPLLKDPKILKVGHHLKFDKLVLKKYDVEVSPFEDTLLLSYLLNSGPHGLDALAEIHFDHRMESFKEVTRSGKSTLTFDQVPLDKATDYAASDADYTYQLFKLLSPKLKDVKLEEIYTTLDLPLVDVLIDMEQRGIKVDARFLKELAKSFDKRLHLIEEDIFKEAGERFNLGSPKQIGEVLFDRLKLEGGKKGKTGAYGTGSDVLEELVLQHELPLKILEWRQLAKLKSTYTTTLINQIDPKTGRVHTSYSMAGTTTGRLSSSDPNLQNIPIRTEEGRKIRKAFVAEEGHIFISFDYSQIELRLLAHMANIPPLREAFIQRKDVHAQTASEVFGIPLDKITPEIRNKAKAINFGIIYGISAFGLARQLKIDRKEAAHYIESYKKHYPGLTEYMEKTVAFGRAQGYVETLWGRRCYIPNLQSKNPVLRSGAERQAINAPLQGSNADIIKKAMIQIEDMLREKGFKTKMLLQVHDELIFEVPLEEVEKVTPLIKSLMENAAHLKIPLTVGVGKGPTWEDAH